MHFGLEMGIVIRGEMTRYFRGGKSVFGAGELWLHNIWEPHGWQIRVVPTEIIVLIILPQTLQQLRFPEVPEFTFLHPFSVTPELRPRVPAARREEVLSIASRLLHHSETSGYLKPLQFRVLLMRLILLISEEWFSRATEPTFRSMQPQSIEPALSLVADSRRFISVKDAASACGLSVKTFRKVFGLLMAISFPKYSLKYRVDGAAMQLLQGNDSIKIFAANWGFTDTSHFDHSFRRFYGCFPNEYRTRYPR